jgi:hypothetical protein
LIFSGLNDKILAHPEGTSKMNELAGLRKSDLQTAEVPSVKPTEFIDKIALVFILSLHIAACFVMLPPWQIFGRGPLLFCDHPVHAYRVFMYKEALSQSGIPWGYDPALSAGKVMEPDSDVGAKPQQD